MRKLYVLGGMNIDIVGRSFHKLVPADSNPGTLSYSFGGVGHNIAANLALLGCPVHFMTAFADDSFGRQGRQDCLDMKMDIADCQLIENAASSAYLAVEDSNGEMCMAISDMTLLARFDIDRAIEAMLPLAADDMVVCDANLSPDQLEKIFTRVKCRLFADPVSAAKAGRIKPYLADLTMLKPNRLEAMTYSGRPLQQASDYKPMLAWFLQAGVKQPVISLGADGLIGSDGQQFYHLPGEKMDIVNGSGGGDAMLAGLLAAEYYDRPFRQALVYGLTAAGCTLMSQDTVCRQLSMDSLDQAVRAYEKSNLIEIL